MEFVKTVTLARVTKYVHVFGAPVCDWGVEFAPVAVEVTYALDAVKSTVPGGEIVETGEWEVESWTLTGMAVKRGRGSRTVTRDGKGDPDDTYAAPEWMADLIGQHRPTVTEF